MAKTNKQQVEDDIGPGPITPAQDALIGAAIASAKARNASDKELSKIVTEIRTKGD